MNMRGLIFASVAALTVTGALAQVHLSQYQTTFLDNTTVVNNVAFFESSNSGSYLYESFGNSVADATSLFGAGNNPFSSMSSFMVGTIGSDIVLFLNFTAASALNGILWENVFLTDFGSESAFATTLSNASSGNVAAQTTVRSFANTLQNYTSTQLGALGNFWFDTSTSTPGNYAVMKFSVGLGIGGGNSTLTPVPEPITLALIGLAPLAYLKRRKSKAA